MKRPATLSATFVRTVRQPGRYGDGRGGHGLSLLVKPTKIEGRLSKTWAQRTRINGKYTYLGLGSYPAVTLAEARRRALRNKQALEEAHHRRARNTPTFRQATEKVIQLHAAKWKPGGLSEQHWRSTLGTYAHPHLSNKTSGPNHQCQYHGLPHPHMAPKTRNRTPGKTTHRRGNEVVHRSRISRRQPSRRPHHRRSGFQHPTTPTHESPTPQPSQHSHQNRRGYRCSLGDHRRVQVPNPHRHPQRRSQKRDMGRNRPCHRNLDNPPTTHQNRKRAPGSTQHRCSGSSRNSTPKIRRPRSRLPVPDRTDPQQHHDEQTLQREQHRLCATRDAKLIPRLVRRNRNSPRSRRTSPRPRNQKRRRKSLRQNRPLRKTPPTNARLEPLPRS